MGTPRFAASGTSSQGNRQCFRQACSSWAFSLKWRRTGCGRQEKEVPFLSPLLCCGCLCDVSKDTSSDGAPVYQLGRDRSWDLFCQWALLSFSSLHFREEQLLLGSLSVWELTNSLQLFIHIYIFYLAHVLKDWAEWSVCTYWKFELKQGIRISLLGQETVELICSGAISKIKIHLNRYF